MPRQPNPKTKDTISFKARSVFDQEKIVAFKKLAIQDGLELSDLFFEAVDLVFVKHNLKNGGNPQRQILSNFEQKSLITVHCGFSGCKGVAVGSAVYLPTNKQYNLCKRHLLEAGNSGKVWR